MGKYYMLECYTPIGEESHASLQGIPDPPGNDNVGWCWGQKFKHPPKEPMELEIDHLVGEPEFPMKELYNNDALVMTKRLFRTLQEAGIDNIDAYETLIRDPVTGFETRDYIAGNLLGLVKCVDLSKSKVVGGSADHRLDTDFEGVAIDEARTMDYDMFRLLENNSAIMVHERIKRFLLKKGFDMLSFIEPGKWIG